MEYMDETTLAHKHTSSWLIAFRIIFTIALVWCILFIFHNSLETSSISSARSHEVMQKINAILAHLNIGPLSEHVVRKLAHFQSSRWKASCLCFACGFIPAALCAMSAGPCWAAWRPRCWMKPSSCMCRAALRPCGSRYRLRRCDCRFVRGPAVAAHRARADLFPCHEKRKPPPACRTGRAAAPAARRPDQHSG